MGTIISAVTSLVLRPEARSLNTQVEVGVQTLGLSSTYSWCKYDVHFCSHFWGHAFNWELKFLSFPFQNLISLSRPMRRCTFWGPEVQFVQIRYKVPSFSLVPNFKFIKMESPVRQMCTPEVFCSVLFQYSPDHYIDRY